MNGSGRGERGAATLLALAMAGVLLMVGAALGVVAAMVSDHRRAQAAADLSALAAAAASARGDRACAVAGELAQLNDAELLDCLLDGASVTVRVRVSGPRWLGLRADFEASARAGPDRAPDEPTGMKGESVDDK